VLRRATTSLLAAASVCAVLAGCGGGNPSGPASGSTSAAANATFARLAEAAGITRQGSPAALRDMAGTICAAYARGRSYDEVITDLTDGGWGAGDARALNAAAVTAYCPQEKSKAQQP
jgi:hypothetical protein